MKLNDFLAIYNLNFRVFLPLMKSQKKQDAPRTCIVRIGAFDPAKYHLSDLIKVSFMVTEILMLEDDNFTVAGEVRRYN